ncbi:unnamed protein product [Arabidopsis thaliana]|uniref:Protein TIC 20 n=1 Tax=Arabidopsis thaliana TaxID=3702 RepID=A0A7G2FH44_ARATH|nr:unnamed protein product [Arabidopsis thaliana]
MAIISQFFAPLPSLTGTLTLTGRSFLPLNLDTQFPKPRLSRDRAATLVLQSKGDDSVDASDRIISAVCYFYPFFDGIQYGKFIITQYQPFQILIQPLFPAIRAFKSFPFNGFLIFITLYFVVVRNPNFSRCGDEFGQHSVPLLACLFDLWILCLLVWSDPEVASCCRGC